MDAKNKRKIAKMYNSYSQDIYRYLYAHGGSKELAEDLLSETFVRAMNSVEGFDFKQPRAWLYTIARNLLRDHWKKKSTVNLNESIELIDQSDSLEDATDKNINADKLMQAIKSLPNPDKEIINLRFMYSLSVKEVAKIIGISPENVRVIQHRALKKMRGLV